MNVRLLPAASVVSPFTDTAPVPVLNVFAPVCEILPTNVDAPV